MVPENIDQPAGGSSDETNWGGETCAEGGRPLLDLRTQLVKPSRPQIQTTGWKFTLWPGCSEASLVIVTSGSSRFRGAGDRPPLSEEAAALHWQIANGRAGTRSRRYFVLNQLRYMWVLTYPGEGQYDRRIVMSEVSEFARRLRIVRNGATFPYWYSPELHPGGHGWHVNFFIPFRIPHSQIEGLWDRGWVWVVDYGTAPHGAKGEPLGLCRTPRDGYRRAAHYGCKYAQKDWSPEHVGAQNHRYEIGQGFSPKKIAQWVQDPLEAEALVADLVPVGERRFLQRWDSNDEPEWLRPPIRTWRW